VSGSETARGTVREVVESGLCTGCGTCVSACSSGAVAMEQTATGLLVATVADANCNSCGVCLSACPGAAVDLGLPDGVDPFTGVLREAYIGHACHGELRSTGQSGGLVSGLLAYLLDTGKIDVAATTVMPDDGSLRPVTVLAETAEELAAGQGSKYCPCPVNAVWKEAALGSRAAVVGVSCHMHGLHKLADKSAFKQDVRYRIGLFCDRTLLGVAIEQMARDTGVDIVDVRSFEYRSKGRSGWPGEPCFHLTSGEAVYAANSTRTSLKDYVTPPRCRLCFDKANVLADLTVGDAWGLSDSRAGESVVIARTEVGSNLLREAQEAGYVELREADVHAILGSQAIEKRRGQFAAYTHAWRDMGRTPPEFVGLPEKDLVSPDRAQIDACRHWLEVDCAVAEADTREASLAAIRRRRRLPRATAFARDLLRRTARRLLRPMRGTKRG
jgi:coenzyme F420 hydrogenase subunit beta